MADGAVTEPLRGAIDASASERDGFVARLYTAHWDELIRYIRKKFGAGPPEPEDVVQAAFTKFAALESPQSLKNPRAFLYATARNAVIDHHRRAKRRAAYEEDALQRAEAAGPSDLHAERVLLDRERLKTVMDALDRLPTVQRRLVLRSRFQGLTCKDIAKREGMTEAAVQKQIIRALAQCLNALDENDDP